MNPTSNGGFHVFSCITWGFTHLTIKKFWVRMKFYQNPRKIKCQQEILVSKVVPHNPKTCIHTSSHSSIPFFIFLSSSFLFFFSSSSFSSSSPLLFSSLRLFSPKLRPNLVLNQGFLLRSCLAPKNPFFWVKSL